MRSGTICEWSTGVAMPVCNRIIWKRSGLQIRGPRFDSGRRLQTDYALAAASATFACRKPPENAPKSHRKVTMTRVDVMCCTWTENIWFSSATSHAAFATRLRGSQHEHRYHEGFSLTVLWVFGDTQFRLGRHLTRAIHYWEFRSRAFGEWQEVACAQIIA